MVSKLRKLSLVGFSLLLLTASLTVISTSASAASSITTCTDLNKQTQLVIKATQKSCKSLLAPALWHIQQSDSAALSGAGYASLHICSSKNPEFTYRFIKKSCPKYQVATDYWRAVVLPATPIITSASALGHHGATFTLSTIIETTDAPVGYYLITNIETGEVSKVAPNNHLQLSISNLKALTSYTFTISAVNIDGTSTSSIITPMITTRAAPIVRVVPSAPVPVIVYAVGDRGPGGGIVFYVSATAFSSTGSICNTNGVSGISTCKYLEVAPATWQSAGVSVADDAKYKWSNNTTHSTPQDVTTPSTEGFSSGDEEIVNWKIGQGFYNTSVMNANAAISDARAAVLAYAGSSTAGQWFIPSMNELNELCKYARGQTTGVLAAACNIGSGTFRSTANAGTDLGGFVEFYYWSSSDAFVDDVDDPEDPYWLAWRMDFRGEPTGYTDRNLAYHVRPVRAF